MSDSICDVQSRASSASGTRRSVLVQSRGLYRPARDSHPSSGTSTPTFTKKISLNGRMISLIHRSGSTSPKTKRRNR